MLYVNYISMKLGKKATAQSKADPGWSDIRVVEPGDPRTQEEWAFLPRPADGSVHWGSCLPGRVAILASLGSWGASLCSKSGPATVSWAREGSQAQVHPQLLKFLH